MIPALTVTQLLKHAALESALRLNNLNPCCYVVRMYLGGQYELDPMPTTAMAVTYFQTEGHAARHDRSGINRVIGIVRNGVILGQAYDGNGEGGNEEASSHAR